MADHAARNGKPLRTGTVWLAPDVAARRTHALTRRAWWTFWICLVSIWAPLLAVAWRSPWQHWIALGIAALLVPWFGRVMGQLGWDQRDLDEQVRTMGGWRVSGVEPRTRRPVTLTGHLVYASHDHVGALARPVLVDLDAIDPD